MGIMWRGKQKFSWLEVISGGTFSIERLKIDKSGLDIGTLHMHSHQRAHDGSDDMVANDFKGEFLGTSGVMDGIRAQYTFDANTVGTMRAIIGNAYIGSGITMSGSGFLVGTMGNVHVYGTVDGSGITLAGVVGGILSLAGATLTEVEHITAMWASSHAVQLPTLGESELLLFTNGLGATLDQVMFVDANDRISEFIHFIDCATMIEAKVDSDFAFAHYRKLRITVDGSPGWLPIEMDS